MDLGFNSGGIPFECVVAQKKTAALAAKKVALVIIYILWVVVWLVIGAITKLLAYLFALVPISLWVIIFFTWRYTQVQYEYSFFAGELTVSRILNDRFRKELITVHIRHFSAVLPYSSEHKAEIERFVADKTVFAASDEDAQGLCVAMWTDEDSGEKIKLYFEPDEKSRKILRYYNAVATTKIK